MSVAGIDEAGRGPLAGPVVAAAVVLDPGKPISGLKDSKQLSEARRETLANEIKVAALSWSVAEASVEEIDELNILAATMLAMKRAVEGLSVPVEKALVDGNQAPALACAVRTIVKGDRTELSISAASILAKQARDAMMHAYAVQYPEFGFGRHKGYGTQAHRAALQQYGVTPIHRLSYAPVRVAMSAVGRYEHPPRRC